MSINKTIFGISAGLLLLSAFLWIMISRTGNVYAESNLSRVNIEKTWELPKELAEISGIAYLEENKIACVQDEAGSIFIYDLKTSEIVDEIRFGGNGDYEGIAIKEATAFVVKSDGKIIKVENFRTDPKISELTTPLTSAQNVEGITYDKKNNQLFLSIKEQESDSENYKGVYAFHLKNGTMKQDPAFKIHMDDAIFKEVKEKKLHNTFKPSEISVHPETGEIYVLEGQNPKLLILDQKKKTKQLYFLNKKQFPQPEGLTFSPSGTMYISSEGNPGTIHQVSLN